MGDLFAGLRSGIQFPQVVMNQGPLPGAGGLPQPLHERPDARINYGSSLLGDLTPYAYGEPGYLSSQNAYLNIPHKIQKIVPKVFLPEAKVGARDFFDLSHPVDDGDLAFVLRLDRSSLFCTGLKNGDMRRAGLGTVVDPLINLCTFNYILSGLQLGITGHTGDLWNEFFYNLDKQRFGKASGMDSRDYTENPIGLDDVLFVVKNCIRPFGIVRGSEKQGGQNESTLSPATWPVSFIVSVTIDGKESNVLNIWHYHDLHAGNDLVLRLKMMPVRPYTLNHYYKGVKRQTWDFSSSGGDALPKFVWQLVPDLFHLEVPKKEERDENVKMFNSLPKTLEWIDTDGVRQKYSPLLRLKVRANYDDERNSVFDEPYFAQASNNWQSMGFWHIGRSQIMTGKYGLEEYWHNDMANTLRTNHLDITLQPMFSSAPLSGMGERSIGPVMRLGASLTNPLKETNDNRWTAKLSLEKMLFSGEGAPPTTRDANGWRAKVARTTESGARLARGDDDSIIPVPNLSSSLSDQGGRGAGMDEPDWLQAVSSETETRKFGSSEAGMTLAGAAGEEPEWLGRLEYTDDPVPDAVGGEVKAGSVPATAPATQAKKGSTSTSASTTSGATKAAKRGRAMVGGSLLKTDGTSEPSTVGML